MKTFIFVVVICFAIVSLAFVHNQPPRMSIRLDKNVALSPAKVIAWVTVERFPANRSLGVELSSDDFYRMSVMGVDNVQTRGPFMFAWRDLQEGEYTAVATLKTADDGTFIAVTHLTVK